MFQWVVSFPECAGRDWNRLRTLCPHMENGSTASGTWIASLFSAISKFLWVTFFPLIFQFFQSLEQNYTLIQVIFKVVW